MLFINLFFYLVSYSNVFSACTENQLLELKQVEGLSDSSQKIIKNYAINFKDHARDFLNLLDKKPPLSTQDLEKEILALQHMYTVNA